MKHILKVFRTLVIVLIVILSAYILITKNYHKTIIAYLFITYLIFTLAETTVYWFRGAVSKDNKTVRIRAITDDYWQVTLFLYFILLITLIALPQSNSVYIIFGHLDLKIVLLTCYVSSGPLHFFRSIRVNKKGILIGSLQKRKIKLNELKSFSLTDKTIVFETKTGVYEYDTIRISKAEIVLITKAINNIIKKTLPNNGS